MDGRRLCFALSLLFSATLCIALENFALDRDVIRKSTLQYRARRSANLNGAHNFSPRFRVRRQAAFPSDDEDIADGSGDYDDGNERLPPDVRGEVVIPEVATQASNVTPAQSSEWVWYRTKINFVDSILYSENLTDFNSEAFHSLSDKIMFGVEEYLHTALPGYHEATPLMFTKRPNDQVDVLVDVGACSSNTPTNVEEAVRSLLRTGRVSDMEVSEEGFSMREVGRDPRREECLVPKETATTSRTTTKATAVTEPTPPDFDVDVDVKVESTRPRACNANQATCRTGQCIDRRLVCDGQRDCFDGSDEPPACGNSAECDPTEFLCPGTGICVQKMWRCDGDDDCGDGFDELSCPSALPGSKCRGIEFECVADDTCVPASYQCDGERDCSDNADELDCARPVVTRPPRRNVTVQEGETVVLHCEAAGVPAPIISWRLNWGNVGAPPRVSMNSINGSGELVIKQVRRSDQGAYTCEAINSQGSIFAIPDAILSVEVTDIEDQPPCPPGQYGMEEDSCRPCYCFGVTDQCVPLEMEYDEVGISFETPDDIGYVELRPAEAEGADPTPASEPINRNQIVVKPAARELQLIDLSKRFLAAAHYWSLPAQFLGAKINSYGGTLTFSFSYNNSYNFDPKPTNYSDVIIEGANGRTLVYRDKAKHPEPEVKHTKDVGLNEDGWKTSDGSSATREDMMGVLNNIDKLLLRTVYDNSMLSTGIGDVRMSVAQDSSSGGAAGQNGAMAYDVEKCVCPEGYSGLSCQYCAPGWERITVGPFVGRCEAILGKETVPCRDGYAGKDCSKCADGYENYGGVCREIGSYRCEPAGTASPDLDGDCNCKINVEGATCNRCKEGFFGLSASNQDGCTRCFCMGITPTCTGSDWSRYKIVPQYTEGDRFLLTNAGSTRRLQDVVNIRRTFGRSQVSADLTRQPRDVFYWVLPAVFTGDRVTSYGGNLRYTVEYNQRDGARPIVSADAKITGHGITLEQTANSQPLPGRPTSFELKMTEEFWVRPDGSSTTREELLMALADVEDFLVRATYSTAMLDTAIYDLSLEAASDRAAGSSNATEMEQCACPPGYRGTSCELCAPRYHRSRVGAYLGTCVRCSCNSHSGECDEETGRCINCRDNTVGDRCDRCADGFYGDPRIGTSQDCKPCPCPLLPSRSDVRRVASCTVDLDGLPTCDECPPGHAGRHCDRCSSGFELDELRACQKTGTSCQCDPNGSVGGTCDEDGQCNCKESVEGTKCDVCKPSYFFFSVENTGGGCLPCFCMGVTKQCESSRFVRDTVTSDFSDGTGGFSLVNRRRSQRITTGLQVRSSGNVLTRPRMGDLPDDIYYWDLPRDFLGNKVVSYGGDLSYTVSYTPLSSGIAVTQPDVIIVGNDITLVAYVEGDVDPRVQTTKTVSFREANWRRTDGQPATREHLLMALADLESLLIRATYSTSMHETTVSDVSMETARADEFDGAEFAYDVERCECPDGYGGLSCEDCSPGFTRSSGGVYLGLCEPCQCNGRAETCNSETGECVNCLEHTTGTKCESCERGFYSMSDDPSDLYCSPCACPSTGENSFSEACEFVSSTRQLLCTECLEGYEGNRCENCAEGYEGNPRVPGGKCVRKRTPELPPIVRVTPSSLSVRDGSPAILRCDVESSTPVEVSWRRTRPAVGPLPPTAIVNRDGSMMTIRRFSRGNSGTYECVARNQGGTGSDSGVLTVAPRRQPMEVRVEEPVSRRLPTGSEVTFVCTARSEMNAYIIYWSKRGGRLPRGRSTEFNGILHITDLREEDAGTYVCTGSNMYDVDQKTAELFVVEDSNGTHPTITITPDKQVVSEGGDARFQCSADGTPPIRIEWRPSAGESMPENARVIDGELYLPTVSLSDSAVFYCRAHNAEGFAEATAVLDVTAVGRPPVVTVVTGTTAHAEEGQNVEMRCVASGVPSPLFSWRRVRQPGLPDNAEPRGGILRLINVRADSQDTYVCTARNAFGEDSGAILVNVTSQPAVQKPVCKTDPEFLTAYVGSDTSVSCIPQGDPLPTVTWVRSDGTPLPSNARIEGNKLVLNSVSLGNAGKYICVATNPGGTTRSEMTLRVEDKSLPEVEILPRNQQVVEIGRSASFTCRATAGHPVEVTWSRTDRKPFTRGTTLEDEGVIRFSNVTQQDGGSYLCIARNVVGFREFATLLTVTRKPTITIEPASDVYLRRGSSMTLRCYADGIPVPNVAWQKIHMFGRGVAISHYKRYSNALHITANEIGESAQYMCIARSAAGDARKKLTVTVGDKETVVAPEATVERRVVSSPIGRVVRLRCAATGYPAPDLTWTKRGGELPEGSIQDNGVLTFRSTAVKDAGTYNCEAVNTGGRDSSDSTLKIIIAPKVEITPKAALIRVAAGQSAVLKCSAYKGSDPITYEFRKVSGEMPDSVEASGDTLRILSFDPDNESGAYICVGINEAGSGNAEVTLLELEAPSVVLLTGEVTSLSGGSIEIRCTAGGTEVEWTRTDGGLDAARTSVADGTLRIQSVQTSDTGAYRCSATNDAGTTAKDAFVLVRDRPTVNISLSSSEVRVGGRLEVKCTGTGNPPPTVSMTMNGEEILAAEDGAFVVESVAETDAGTYACLAESDAGTARDEIDVEVLAPLMISIIPNTAVLEARSGEELAISCIVKGTDLPVTWTAENADLSSDALVFENLLQINQLSTEDAGVYKCTAEAEGNTLEQTIKVVVEAYIPSFTQSPVSYLAVSGSEEFSNDLAVTVSFRSNSEDGLILYSSGSGGDYMCLVLVKGKVEFRYNVGSGDAVIVSRDRITMSEWHTVTVSRDGREGQLAVDGEEPVYGSSEGTFEALDLVEPLFVGGYPTSGSPLPEALQFLGVDVGFYGCISQLIIGGVGLDLGSSALIVDRVGILRCKTCGSGETDSPCLNEASCAESHATHKGYVCGCSEEYVGPECQFRKEDICGDLGICGDFGSCTPDYERELGYRCECFAGYLGPKCQFTVNERVVERPPPDEDLDTPDVGILPDRIVESGPAISEATSFSKGSYMELDVDHGDEKEFQVKMRVKLRSLDDGLILYNGGVLSRRKRAVLPTDIFVSVAMLNGSLEFRYSCGSGLATLPSEKGVLEVDRWHTIFVSRANRKGILKVDSEIVAEGHSPKGGRRAVLDGPLFIGGVKYWDRIPAQVGVTEGFDGCIEEIYVDEKHASLHAAVSSKNVENCESEEATTPTSTPTTATTTTTASTTTEEYGGGPLFIDSGIPAGFSGSSARFSSDSLISFPSETFSHAGVAEQFSMYFKTKHTDGLMLLQGNSDSDYILLGMRGARLEYMFQLGLSQTKFSSPFPLADGRWHNVTVLRRGALALMWVDDLRPIAIQAKVQPPADLEFGDLLIGGALDVSTSTGDRYRKGFHGCIKDVKITSLTAKDAETVGTAYFDDGRRPLRFGVNQGRKAIKGVSSCRPDRIRAEGFD